VKEFEQPRSRVGTGFFVVSLGEGKASFITNRHLVDPLFRPEDRAEWIGFGLSEAIIEGRPDGETPRRLKVAKPNAVYTERPDIDAAAIPFIRAHAAMPNFTVDDSSGPATITNGFAVDELATDQDFTQNLLPLDQVAFPGYHEWHDEAAIRPTYRVGWIVSDCSKDVEVKGKKGPIVVIEGYSTDGASGSPVISTPILVSGSRPTRGAKLIGINAGHFEGYGLKHANLSYFYKASVILECHNAWD